MSRPQHSNTESKANREQMLNSRLPLSSRERAGSYKRQETASPACLHPGLPAPRMRREASAETRQKSPSTEKCKRVMSYDEDAVVLALTRCMYTTTASVRFLAMRKTQGCFFSFLFFFYWHNLARCIVFRRLFFRFVLLSAANSITSMPGQSKKIKKKISKWEWQNPPSNYPAF
jgi:hypothetical protein